MNSDLNNFFKEEQKRVFEPGPYFAQRVMARLATGASGRLAPSVWDVLPNAMRPIMGMALLLLFAVLAVQILIPVDPPRGAIEAYVVQQDLSPREQMLLFAGADGASAAQIEELMVLEPEPLP
jgi:hypothetical protein